MRALAALLFASALNAALLARWTPPGQQVHLAPEDAVRHVGFMALGMRRLAADLAFIRMLVYYGTPEDETEHPYGYLDEYYSDRPEDEHPHGGHEGGHYPELGPRALRILELDPYFSYAPLYAAGALAFNLQRPDEALSVLEQARRREPRNWRYAAYLAAIAFHKEGDGRKVLEELSPVLADPECPTMLKNIAAYLCVRYGRKEDAVRLYEEILQSRDQGYHAEASRNLRALRPVP